MVVVDDGDGRSMVFDGRWLLLTMAMVALWSLMVGGCFVVVYDGNGHSLWCLMLDGCFVVDDGDGRSMVFDG